MNRETRIWITGILYCLVGVAGFDRMDYSFNEGNYIKFSLQLIATFYIAFVGLKKISEANK